MDHNGNTAHRSVTMGVHIATSIYRQWLHWQSRTHENDGDTELEEAAVG